MEILRRAGLSATLAQDMALIFFEELVTCYLLSTLATAILLWAPTAAKIS